MPLIDIPLFSVVVCSYDNSLTRTCQNTSKQTVMWKRKQASWESFKEKISRKRTGKVENVVFTVERLSADVQGKYQKYSCIGPLTMVLFRDELSIVRRILISLSTWSAIS